MIENINKYMKEYMKDYIKSSPIIQCPLCNTKYKKVYEYKHKKTKNHVIINNFNKKINVI